MTNERLSGRARVPEELSNVQAWHDGVLCLLCTTRKNARYARCADLGASQTVGCETLQGLEPDVAFGWRTSDLKGA